MRKKKLIAISFLLIICFQLNAQKKNIDKNKNKDYQNLKVSNFKDFINDKPQILQKTNEFKNRLVRVNWLIENNKQSLINDEFKYEIKVFYHENVIDSMLLYCPNIAIFGKNRHYELSADSILNETIIDSNLNGLSKVKKINYTYQGCDVGATNVEPVYNPFQSNKAEYNRYLLKEIHELLKLNYKKLKLKENSYEASDIESANMNLEERITNRENFIKYIIYESKK